MLLWSHGSCVNPQITIWYQSYWFWCSDYPLFGQWELLQASSHVLLTCVCMFLEFIQVLCPVLPQSQSSPQGVLVPSSGKCPSKPRSWLWIYSLPLGYQWSQAFTVDTHGEIRVYIHRHTHMCIYTSTMCWTKLNNCCSCCWVTKLCPTLLQP